MSTAAMKKRALSLVLAMLLLSSQLVRADDPPPLPDAILTPNASYLVQYTDDHPYDASKPLKPGDDSNYFPSAKAQMIADALDNNGWASTVAAQKVVGPNGYHAGYAALGFLPPLFLLADEVVNPLRPILVYDCLVDVCKSGAAAADNKILIAASRFIGESEPCIRNVLGHELFHVVQFTYLNDMGNAWGNVAREGTARMMEDKVFSDLDIDVNCSGYLGEVNSYLQTPNQPLWNDKYGYQAALFWNYLSEQLGTVTEEPQVGVDFMRAFWQTAQLLALFPDTPTAIRITAAQFDASATLEGLFQDFTIANYAKDLDVSGLADGVKYSYVDEGDKANPQDVRPHYEEVRAEWRGVLPPIEQNAGSVVRWGANYYEAKLTPPDDPLEGGCQGVAGFVFDGDLAAYSVLAVKGDDKVERLHKSVTGHFARAFVQSSASPYTRLVVVVAGLSDPASYNYKFACGPVALDVLEPNADYQAYAGKPRPGPGDPFLIRLTATGPAALGSQSVEGLNPTDFAVYVGPPGPLNQVTVLSGARVQGEYWLVVQAPHKDGSAGSVYPLTVQLGTASDTESQAVEYSQLIVDQVLVIDRSASMLEPAESPKIDAAKAAANLYVDAAGTDDMLGVVSFSGDDKEPNDDATITPNGALANVTDERRESAHEDINNLQASGFTSIGDGILKGTDLFTHGNPIGQNWLILLSDGHENEAKKWDDIKFEIQKAGIYVFPIALGPDTDQGLMQQIGDDTKGHDYIYVPLDLGTAVASAVTDRAAHGANSALPNRLADAYALATEQVRRHERLWEQVGTIALGSSQVYTIEIAEGGIADSIFSFNWTNPEEELGVEIRRPDQSLVQNGVAGARIYSSHTHVVAQIGSLTPGVWRITLKGTVGAPDFLGILSGRNQQGATLNLYFAQSNDEGLENQGGIFLRGLPQPILVSLTDRSGPILGASVTAVVEHPDGQMLTLRLLDDGSHGDGNANDGIYGNLYTRTTGYSRPNLPDDPATVPPEMGSYIVTVVAQGKDNNDTEFHRIKKGSFQVFDYGDQQDPDPDGDGMPTRYEQLHNCLNSNIHDGALDGEQDAVLNRVEYDRGTDPCHPDTDRGGESDASELNRGANAFDPLDDALPRPIDVEVVNSVSEHVPGLILKPNTNLIRYPVNQAYDKIRLYRSTNAAGPFALKAEFGALSVSGLYYDQRLANGTTYYYKLAAVDLNGNTSAPSHIFSGTPKLDPYPPIGSVSINNGKAYVAGTNVILSLRAVSDTAQVLIANDASFPGATWEAYAYTKTWTIEPDPATGFSVVFVKYRDGAANESNIYHDLITAKPGGSLGYVKGVITWPQQQREQWQPSNHAGGVFIMALGTSETSSASTFTAADGSFVLEDLLPGTYDVHVERTGFAAQVINGVNVGAGRVTDIGSVTLRPGSLYLPLVNR